jgi:hypothetical protein
MAFRAVAIPTAVQNCRVWLDATDTNSIISAGGNVSQWNDKSNNGANVLKSGSGNITIGTNPARIILSGNAYLQNSFTDSINTIFFVYNAANASPLYSTSDTTNGFTGFFPVYSDRTYIDRGTLSWHSPTNIFTADALTLAVVQYSTNITVWSNGTSVISDITYNSVTRNWFRLGNRSGGGHIDFMTGSFNEVILYNRALGDSERQTIETYLAAKWGLASLLPTSHPGFGSSALVRPALSLVSFSRFFSPRSIQSCTYWLDAAQETATTNTTSTTIADRSGTGYTTTKANGSLTITVNSLNGLSTYNIGFDRLIVPSFQWQTDFTTFAVFRGVAGGFSMSQQPTATYTTYINSFNWDLFTVGSMYGKDSINPLGTLVTPANQWNIFAIGYKSGQTILNVYKVNGNDRTISTTYYGTAQALTTYTSSLFINGNNNSAYETLEIAELIHYNYSMTNDEAQTIESYLIQKWGLGSRVPTTHPTFTNPAGRPRGLPAYSRGLNALVRPSFTIGNATLGTDYTITTGQRTFYNFLAVGKTMTLSLTQDAVVEILAIGGGGGGGTWVGGGGGAGGLQQLTNYNLPAGNYNIVLGSGGVGAIGSFYSSTSLTFTASATNGGATTFGNIVTANGGGFGASYFQAAAGNGGCGGGGVNGAVAGTGNQGFGAIGNIDGCGGGGVNSAGIRYNGGVGITYNNGTQLSIGGGGGSGGGGGATGTASHGGGAGGIGLQNGTSGTPNTGGGGGGTDRTSSSTALLGGNGGSGILIISYFS